MSRVPTLAEVTHQEFNNDSPQDSVIPGVGFLVSSLLVQPPFQPVSQDPVGVSSSPLLESEGLSASFMGDFPYSVW